MTLEEARKKVNETGSFPNSPEEVLAAIELMKARAMQDIAYKVEKLTDVLKNIQHTLGK
jgi:hypothetical protein